MDFKQFQAWFVPSLFTILVAIIGYFGVESLAELKSIRKEMTDLNIKLVAVIDRGDYHELRIQKLESDVELLKERKH